MKKETKSIITEAFNRIVNEGVNTLSSVIENEFKDIIKDKLSEKQETNTTRPEKKEAIYFEDGANDHNSK